MSVLTTEEVTIEAQTWTCDLSTLTQQDDSYEPYDIPLELTEAFSQFGIRPYIAKRLVSNPEPADQWEDKFIYEYGVELVARGEHTGESWTLWNGDKVAFLGWRELILFPKK